MPPTGTCRFANFAKPERRTLKSKISQICLQEIYALKCFIFTSKSTQMRMAIVRSLKIRDHNQLLADRRIGYWHDNVVCLSVRL